MPSKEKLIQIFKQDAKKRQKEAASDVERFVMCELCDADERTESQAETDGWKLTWEGWICGRCYEGLQGPHAKPYWIH